MSRNLLSTSIIILAMLMCSPMIWAQSFSVDDYEEYNEIINTHLTDELVDSLHALKLDQALPVLDCALVDAVLLEYFSRMNQLDECIEYGLEALPELSKHHYAISQSVRRTIASAYINQKRFTKGCEMLVLAEELAQTNNDTIEQCAIYDVYAHLYYNQGKKGKAYEALKKSELLYEQIGDTLGLSYVYNNLAVLTKIRGQYRKAIDYNLKSLQLNLTLCDTIYIAESYNNLGNNYRLLFKRENNTSLLDSAIYYFNASIALKQKFPLLNNTAAKNLADLYQDLSQYAQAEELYNALIEDGERNESWEFLSRLYENQRELLVKQHKYKEAHLISIKREDAVSKLHTIKTQDHIDALDTQRSLLKTQKEVAAHKITMQEQQQSMKLLNARRQLMLVILLFVVFVIILGVAYVLLYIRNYKLSADKERILLEQRVLTSQMNPHFIFNVLAAIQSSILKNDTLKTASHLARFARIIRQTFDFTQRDSITLEEEVDALVNYIEAQKMRFNDNFNYAINVGEDIDKSLIMVPPMLLQPLVENSIEHGFRGIKYEGFLNIRITANDNTVFFEIEDNGLGLGQLKQHTKLHSLDVLKQRLGLLKKNGEKSLELTNRSDKSGAIVKFEIEKCIK